jgi:hypothetical protein
MLLDRDLRSEAAERAQQYLAVRTPRGSCEAVTAAAVDADPAAVEHALLALTVLGDNCLAQIDVLADQQGVAGEVRGAALEIAAVLESPKLCEHLALAKADKVWHPAIERAEAMRHPRCTAAAPGDTPLPPRIFHEGM